jgi:hypothetical protein
MYIPIPYLILAVFVLFGLFSHVIAKVHHEKHGEKERRGDGIVECEHSFWYMIRELF